MNTWFLSLYILFQSLVSHKLPACYDLLAIRIFYDPFVYSAIFFLVNFFVFFLCTSLSCILFIFVFFLFIMLCMYVGGVKTLSYRQSPGQHDVVFFSSCIYCFPLYFPLLISCGCAAVYACVCAIPCNIFREILPCHLV